MIQSLQSKREMLAQRLMELGYMDVLHIAEQYRLMTKTDVIHVITQSRIEIVEEILKSFDECELEEETR